MFSEHLQVTTMLSSLSRLLFVWDDDNHSKPTGASRIPRRAMEPAPPTYEEALSLFVRDSSSSNNVASSNGAHRADRLARPATGSRGNAASSEAEREEDHEMAERLQREEYERYATRERSATARDAQATGLSEGDRERDDRADTSRSGSSFAPPDRADTSESSTESPVDFRSAHRRLRALYGQRRTPPPIPGLRTIPESERLGNLTNIMQESQSICSTSTEDGVSMYT